MKNEHLRSLIKLWMAFTAFTLILMLRNPSEATSAFLFGFSKARLVLIVFILLFFVLQAAALIFLQRSRSNTRLSKINQWLVKADRLWSIQFSLMLAAILCFGAFIFTWLIFPAVLRPLVLLLCLLLISLLVFNFLVFKDIFKTKKLPAYVHFLPKFRNLDQAQKRTFWILVILGLLYLLAFVPANLQNTQSDHIFKYNSGDEGIIYTILI